MRRRLVVLALFCPFVLTAKAPLIAPGGLYVLINRANLLDMTVLGGHSSDGTRVTQAAVAGEAADLWKFETAGEAYRIVGMGGSSFALDAGEGRLSVRSSTGSPSQLWSVEESEPGFVRIENKSRGCFLSAPVADNINAPLVCLEATAPKVPTTRSEWMLYRFDGESARALYPVLIEKIRRNMAAAKDKDRGEQTRQILIETIIHQVI
ncbi:MAG: RICIN domain-containing protein, partial [Spirochaetia bacterium]|nr:RICIN domain-containing protein [Spirochaetia bacterium]